jgi:hypothetical protein
MHDLAIQYNAIIDLWINSGKVTSVEDLTLAIKQFNEEYLMRLEKLNPENCKHDFEKFKTIEGAFCIFCGETVPF